MIRMDYEFKREIVDVAHMMSREGLVGTYEGNISIKDRERIYVSPSGHSKELLTEGQIVVTDLQGNQLEGQLSATSEIPMHARCYELRDDINAVIHCHAPFATAYAQLNMEINNRISPEFMLLFGKVPLLPYGRPGTQDIVEELESYIQEYDVFLLANHGVLAVGKTVMEAFSKTVSLEMLLKTEVIRKIISNGKNNDLPKDECEELLRKGLLNHGNLNRILNM